MNDIDLERLYWSLKSQGIVQSKEEFWIGMDLDDLSTAGAFIDKNIWDKFIVTAKRITVGATKYANN